MQTLLFAEILLINEAMILKWRPIFSILCDTMSNVYIPFIK